MITIFIDNRPYAVESGQNLLKACLSLGFDLPYFCWHPAMHSVGACRQCAVKQFKDENDKRGKIIMACMTPVTEGLRISIDDPEAMAFRKGIIELLMINHPHDCPVCDEGGECHLQDMTVMTGHTYRAYRFKKRTYRNQNLGPFVNHEMNRCIQCYRCVRFYRDYAGGRDLDVFGAHDHVYFGRHEDGVLESEFSGNLVEVCPTGVFTDRTFKPHYTRKWDLQTAPSICCHCGLGCNIIASERYGTLRRILNRFNRDVNGYFLCDRGRFGYGFVNSNRRIVTPIAREPGTHSRISLEAAVSRAVEIIRNARGVIGIGSPRASLEANFALRALVGQDRFYSGMSDREGRIVSLMTDILRNSGLTGASLRDVEEADAVIILGEDIPNTSPRLGLSIRQAVRNRPMEIAKGLGIPEWHDAAVRYALQDEKGPLYIIAPVDTRLDDIATRFYRAAPDEIARFGYAVAHELDPAAPHAYSSPDAEASEAGEMSLSSLVHEAAETLLKAERPLIITGAGCMSEAVIQAAYNIAMALHSKGKDARLFFCMPECNSMGLSLLGGKGLSEAVDAVKRGIVDTLVILENDLYRRLEHHIADALLCAPEHVIVLDYIETETTKKAGLLLPSAPFAEADGTFVNSFGLAQRSFKVYQSRREVREGWRWLCDIMKEVAVTGAPARDTFDDILSAAAHEILGLAPLKNTATTAGFRLSGMKIPRLSHRHSGRTSMYAHINVHEQQTPDDRDSPLSFSMEGYAGIPPAPLVTRYWYPGWNSVQALNKFQREVGAGSGGGEPGIRLFGSAPSHRKDAVRYFGDIPAPFRPRPGEFLFIPIYHVFGSEELSSESFAISGLAPRPYVAVRDAGALALTAGEEVEVKIGDTTIRLILRERPGLPAGVAGYPAGLMDMPFVHLPQYGKIEKIRP